MIAASAWVLDLTRLVSRMGRGPLTGIDRVEMAYLQHFLTRPEPLFGLVRTALGFVVLDRQGAGGILDRMTGAVPLGQADLLAKLTQRHMPQNARAEADARRLALARGVPFRLGTMLCKWVPRGAVYLNVGHSNLTAHGLGTIKAATRGQVWVMVHDTIPLDHPQLCRAGTKQGFARKLAAVSAHADLVVHTAICTKAQTEAHLARLGRVPRGVVAALGCNPVAADATRFGQDRQPYFVILGTIEPRKNLGLLVRVWRELQKADGPVPHLFVVGNRGWESPAVFSDLEALAKDGVVTLLHHLGDASVTALLLGAKALLFPSLAEGFGLPPLEAAALGVPVLSGKLPVVVETLQDYPVYLDTSDVYAWVTAVNQMTYRTPGRVTDRQIWLPPRWADHFEQVFGTA